MKESSSVYQSLFNSAPTAILVVDTRSDAILDANPQFQELFGYTPAESRSMRFADLLSTSGYLNILSGNQTDDSDSQFVTYAINRAGEKFLARFNRVADESGNSRAFVYVHQADGFIQSLYWQSIVENLPSIAVLLNENAEVVYANHLPEPYDLTAVIGTRATNFLPPEAKAKFEDGLNSVFLHGKSATFETSAYSGDRQLRVYQLYLSPVRDNGNTEIHSALLVAADVTEVASNRKEKQELDSILAKLQHIAHIGSWSWDVVKNDMHWSDEMSSIFGVDRQKYGNKLWDMIYQCIHPEDRQAFKENMLAIREGKNQNWGCEYRIKRHNDGKLRYLWVDGEYTNPALGGENKVIGFAQDITDYKLMQLGLKSIAMCSAESGGMKLIREMLVCFAQSTGVDSVFIARVAKNGCSKMKTMAFFRKGKFVDNIQYDIAGTPCEEVLANGLYYQSGNLQSEFPSDHLLLALNANSYIGVALLDINGKEHAILAALHHDEFDHPEIDKALLQICAARIASELNRMETQQRLEDSELHFRTAINSAGIATWEWDLAKNSLIWSDNVSSLLPETPADFVAYQTLVHPDDIQSVLIGLQTSLKQEQPLALEHRILTEEGETWVSLKGRFVESESGITEKFMGIISDISAEKKALIDNRQMHSRLDMLVKQTPLGIIEMDRECRIVEWNAAAEKIFGFSKQEVLGKSAIETIVPQGEKLDVTQVWHSLISKSGGERNINDNVTKSGDIIICDWHNTPLVDEKGEVVGVAAIVEDITERIGIEQELQTHREHLEDLVDIRTSELKRINRELQAFSYSVSHDLRAPLRAIDGFSQILAEEYVNQLDETALDYINRVRHGAHNMANLIDDLLKLSRISRGQVNRKVIDLSTIATDIVNKLQAETPERSVSIHVQSGLEAKADPGLLKVVLENLLGNAWKYSRFKEDARIEFAKVVQRENEAVYVVKDNGVGFNMKFVDKLFGAFQRLHDKDKKFEGSGIGLATVQRIIRLHGGQVWAEGREQAGASFYFSLPTVTKDVEKPHKMLRDKDSPDRQVEKMSAH